MQIPLATPQVGSEPPRPPPPPPPAPPASNTDTQRSNAPTDRHLQDTATRKQQQPLSAISIQDLNSVQVNEDMNKSKNSLINVRYNKLNIMLFI